MTPPEFFVLYNRPNAHNLLKRFNECIVDGVINYSILDICIQDANNIVYEAQTLLVDKTAKDICHLFNNYAQAYLFINKIYRSPYGLVYRKLIVDQCMMIIYEFGDKSDY